MKNSKLFIKLSCLIPALLILCTVNLKAQNYLNGYYFLGQRPDYNQTLHYYYISNCWTTWEEANAAAIEMGGYLATLTDVEENDWLGYLISSPLETFGWIGLRGENGIYEWTNGETSSFESWATYPQEPFYADGAALLGEHFLGSQYWTWNTFPVTGEFQYIVEFPYQPNCNNPNKTYVCHNGNTICISVSSLQSHLDHGCLAGPCGPCNTNAMQASPGEIKASEGHSHCTVNEISEPHEEHDLVQERQLPNQIHIYPNPASEAIRVILPEVVQEGALRLSSLSGEEMHKLTLRDQKTFSLDLSGYAAGIYLIEVQSANGHYRKKIVKM